MCSRHEQGPNGEVVPRYADRLVLDGTLRGRLGPGGRLLLLSTRSVTPQSMFLGILNPDEDCRQAEAYLKHRARLSAPPMLTHNPSGQQRSSNDQQKRDELARHFTYTSVQQAAYDEVPWGRSNTRKCPIRSLVASLDSRLPSKLPVPPSTYEADGCDPVSKSKHVPSLLDARTRDILEWDRAQARNAQFYRKPIENVAPLPRAHQVSGYSGCIGGTRLQEIDDPTVAFQPFTVLRSQQPKFGINPL